MKTRGIRLIASFLIYSLFAVWSTAAFCQDHIKELDAARASMAELGKKMPDAIRNAAPQDIRTLENVFEMNNYSMVAIEAYLKMIKISVSSGSGIDKSIVGILNGWLQFISNYCEYDIKYLEELSAETKDENVADLIRAGKNNAANLKDIAVRAIEENNKLFRQL